MENAVKSRLQSVQFGEVQTYKSIVIVPLIAPADGMFQYRTLGEALATSKTKKPAFRRTPVSVDRSFLPALIRRYRAAWKRITRIHEDGEPPPPPDCWQCGSYIAW